jgi:hypothetical protein
MNWLISNRRTADGEREGIRSGTGMQYDGQTVAGNGDDVS